MSGMMSNVSGVPGGPHPSQPMQPSHTTADSVDPATKFKILVPHLKESLHKIMSNAAALFYQNSQFDSCQKVSAAAVQRFDKSLEEFYAICDQIEMNLSLSLEVLGINADCQRNTPITMQAGVMKYAPGPLTDLQTYNQYQGIVRMQLTCAKEVHDTLLECARKIGVDRQSQGTSS